MEMTLTGETIVHGYSNTCNHNHICGSFILKNILQPLILIHLPQLHDVGHISILMVGVKLKGWRTNEATLYQARQPVLTKLVLPALTGTRSPKQRSPNSVTWSILLEVLGTETGDFCMANKCSITEPQSLPYQFWVGLAILGWGIPTGLRVKPLKGRVWGGGSVGYNAT